MVAKLEKVYILRDCSPFAHHIIRKEDSTFDVYPTIAGARWWHSHGGIIHTYRCLYSKWIDYIPECRGHLCHRIVLTNGKEIYL